MRFALENFDGNRVSKQETTAKMGVHYDENNAAVHENQRML
jgi:hypothetical protein